MWRERELASSSSPSPSSSSVSASSSSAASAVTNPSLTQFSGPPLSLPSSLLPYFSMIGSAMRGKIDEQTFFFAAGKEVGGGVYGNLIAEEKTPGSIKI